MTYDPNGNISSKYDVGTYDYNLPQPHAVSSIHPPSGSSPMFDPGHSITFNSFEQPTNITNNTFGGTSYTLNIKYGWNKQRIQSEYNGYGSWRRTYLGDYEILHQNGLEHQIHYVSAGNGLTLMHVKTGETETDYYLVTDHLGSICHISDKDRNTVQEYSFDAWGRSRNPDNWDEQATPPNGLFYRGYTGHEHLAEFSLINMNGRLYDPILGRMLSPDNNVQAPGSTQGYNRYSYCFNNPLKYTDPSGEIAIPAFVFPTIGWSYNSGFSVGVTAGIGVPGAASVQYSYSYGLNTNSHTHSLSASAGYTTAYASYSVPSGWTNGISHGLTNMNSPISSNIFSVGLSYNWKTKIWNYQYMGFNINKYGVTFDPSFSVSPVIYTYNGNSNLSYLGQRAVENYKAKKEFKQMMNNTQDELLYSDNISFSRGIEFLDVENQEIIYGSESQTIVFDRDVNNSNQYWSDQENRRMYFNRRYHYEKYGEEIWMHDRPFDQRKQYFRYKQMNTYGKTSWKYGSFYIFDSYSNTSIILHDNITVRKHIL